MLFKKMFSNKGFHMGQDVTWVKKSPWPPEYCQIEQLYSFEARVRWYSRRIYNYEHAYVSIKRLLPGHITDVNEDELKKLLNPRYKKKTRPELEDDELDYETGE